MELHTELILPDPIIYGVLLFGVALALWRPYWAFLFATFLSIAIDARTLFHSRLSGLGEYFNLSDGCVLLCIVAAATDCMSRRQTLRVPLVPIAMVGVLLLGYANSNYEYGYTYDSLRALRWALNLPILYVIGTNLLVSEQRVRQLFVVLFCGGVVAEIQHVLLVMSDLDAMRGNERQLRLLSFQFAHSEAWLIAGPFMVAGKLRKPWLQFAAAALFIVANLTHQTRSLLIAAVCALALQHGWLSRGRLLERFRRFRPVVVALSLGILLAVPLVGFGGFVDSYSDRMDQLSLSGEGTTGRHEAVGFELQDWLDGNLLIGRGLGYYSAAHRTFGDDDVAWGHIGYVSYLSQMGLIGLLVYGILFPLDVILKARRLLRTDGWGDSTQYMIGFAGALLLYMTVIGALSGSFLGTDGMPGILAGLVAAAFTGRLALSEEHEGGPIVGVS